MTVADIGPADVERLGESGRAAEEGEGGWFAVGCHFFATYLAGFRLHLE